MAQQRHSHEAFTPHQHGADIISISSKKSEQHNVTEQHPAQLHLIKWLGLSEDSSAVAERILHDVTADTDDEHQGALKEALRSSVLYDYYDALLDIDPIMAILEQRARELAQSGEGMTSTRKATIALMEVRATELIESPEQDIPLQLSRLPLGDEDNWQQLIERLKG